MKRSYWINHFYLNIFLSLICFCQSAKAEWLSICQNPNPLQLSALSKTYYKTSGDQFQLAFGLAKQNNCPSYELDIKADEIKWMEIVPRELVKQFGSKILLHTHSSDEGIKVTEILPLSKRSVNSKNYPATIPININILDDVRFKPFGLEERAQIKKRSKETIVHCSQGNKPAGVVADFSGSRLPFSMPLLFSAKYRADENIQFALSDQVRFEKGDPILLGKTMSSMALRQLKVNIPTELNRKSALYFSIVCPNTNASLQLEKLILLPTKRLSKSHRRGMWFWLPELWKDKSLAVFQRLEKYQAGHVYISIPVNLTTGEVKHREQLRDFLKRAAKRNVDVWAVEGDPNAILSSEIKRFSKRSQIIAKFNQGLEADVRMAGIQYDIEPYLITGYNLDVDAWLEAYINAIAELRQTTDMPIEIVIPFWWHKVNFRDKPLLTHLSPLIDSVNVMAYRSSATLLERFAQPLLNWGVDNKKPINIALETGPLVSEQQWRFKKAKAGNLWHVQIENYDVLIYLNSHLNNPDVGVYKQYATRDLDVNEITFKDNLDKMHQLLPKLENSWRSWSSYSGTSLHGLDQNL